MEVQRPIPLYMQVYQILREQILDGLFKPGETLLESRIADQLNVSRTPVREALRKLTSERLIVSDGSELRVANPDTEAILELYTCRSALEAIVAAKSSEIAEPAEIEEMEKTLNDAESAIQNGSRVDSFTANTRFHDLMVQSARMPLLSELLDTIRGPILIARRQILARSAEVERGILIEHRKILEAIRLRDPELARQRMEEHMKHDMERVGIQS
ncbi:GntR family transcriptional regulator [Alicyclobacillus ferrooxydans]|uniref:HTH gntR-type domain-containing protein n=1 Tax=Alicyclobacillus ferrooxydans TaxID=471514 RepID=A0A0N8PPD9_9BACL|nr:GntR family transcriptional regulator [Alicyclobacillus ferrooxydans]KPV44053.1 hypothetical protein AN477_09175 [Alicyclobacillus ferrooxydans]